MKSGPGGFVAKEPASRTPSGNGAWCFQRRYNPGKEITALAIKGGPACDWEREQEDMFSYSRRSYTDNPECSLSSLELASAGARKTRDGHCFHHNRRLPSCETPSARSTPS